MNIEPIVRFWWLWLVLAVIFYSGTMLVQKRRRKAMLEHRGPATGGFAPIFFLSGFGTLNALLFLTALTVSVVRYFK